MLSSELIEFCMHALRMQTVKEEALRLLEQFDDPRRTGWSHVVEAFEDGWKDAEMYAYFSNP